MFIKTILIGGPYDGKEEVIIVLSIIGPPAIFGIPHEDEIAWYELRDDGRYHYTNLKKLQREAEARSREEAARRNAHNN